MILVTLRAGGVPVGPSLHLQRDPALLRFVSSRFPDSLDALDQLDDTPKDGETVYTARLVKRGRVHLHCARGSKLPSGWYQTAEYELIDPQPEQAVMRDRDSWEKWAREWWAANKPATIV